MKRRSTPKTLPDWTPNGRLKGICDVLNAVKDTARGQELVHLVDEWMKAPSLAAMLRGNRNIDQDLRLAVEHYFDPSRENRSGAYRVVQVRPDDSPHSIAVGMFADLVTNEMCEKLAGPCARCGNYYIKKRESQKVYCSRKCGNAATALKRTRERLKEERREKLANITRAIQQWKHHSRTRLDWKSWVVMKTKLDPRFITRAVTNGDLVPPTKGR